MAIRPCPGYSVCQEGCIAIRPYDGCFEMKYHDLRDFIAQLEKLGELKRVSLPVSTHLEMTEICDRVLRAQGPAVLFENPVGHKMSVLANLFGTPRRVALGMGEESVAALREVGKLLAFL